MKTTNQVYTEDDLAWQRPHHHSGNSVIGLLFIFIGLTIFLNMVGIVPWLIWHTIFHFWPLLLVLIGLQMLLFGPMGELVVLVVALLVLVSVWTKGLYDVSSPLISAWSLDKLPWYNWLIQLHPLTPLTRRNF